LAVEGLCDTVHRSLVLRARVNRTDEEAVHRLNPAGQRLEQSKDGPDVRCVHQHWRERVDARPDALVAAGVQFLVGTRDADTDARQVGGTGDGADVVSDRFGVRFGAVDDPEAVEVDRPTDLLERVERLGRVRVGRDDDTALVAPADERL